MQLGGVSADTRPLGVIPFRCLLSFFEKRNFVNGLLPSAAAQAPPQTGASRHSPAPREKRTVAALREALRRLGNAEGAAPGEGVSSPRRLQQQAGLGAEADLLEGVSQRQQQGSLKEDEGLAVRGPSSAVLRAEGGEGKRPFSFVRVFGLEASEEGLESTRCGSGVSSFAAETNEVCLWAVDKRSSALCTTASRASSGERPSPAPSPSVRQQGQSAAEPRTSPPEEELLQDSTWLALLQSLREAARRQGSSEDLLSLTPRKGQTSLRPLMLCMTDADVW